MKWLRRLLILCSVLVIVGAIASVAGYRLLRGRPNWYRGSGQLDSKASADAAQLLQEKVTAAATWTARAQNAQAHPEQAGGAKGSFEPLDLTLTEPEIQAYADRWDERFHWRDQYRKYVVDPQLAIFDQNIVFAGTLPDLADMVLSAHFHMEVDDKGLLRLRLVKVLGGQLPLPRVLWDRYRSSVLSQIRARLPIAQEQATLKPDGSANDAMVEAVLEKLMLHVIADEPSEPVLFLPYMQNYREHNLPVKLVRAVVDDQAKSLTLRFEPLGSSERDALITSVKEPFRSTGAEP